MVDEVTERSFGEYLIDILDNANRNEIYAVRQLYSLIAPVNGDTALTYGQEVLMGLTDFSQFFLMTVTDNPDYDDVERQYQARVDSMIAANNGQQVSVWIGVNTEIYKNSESVYLTSALARKVAASNRYNMLTQTETVEDELKTSQKVYNAMMIVASVGAVALGVLVMGLMLGAKATAFIASAPIIAGWAVGIGTASTALYISHIVSVVSGIVLAIVAVCIIILLIIYFVEKNQEDDGPSGPEFKWIDIPQFIYDQGTQLNAETAAIYQVVDLCGTDTPADLNGYQDEIPWMCLYYSKSLNAGKALVTNRDNTFTVAYNDMGTPEGFSPLTFFEEGIAANLNEGAEGEAVFAYFHREGGAEASSTEETLGKYIADVILTSGSSESEAISAIRKKGYTPVYNNITSDSKVFTYIGYKTTDDASKAITDLRVAYSAGVDKKGGKVTLGSASYGICGYVGELILCETAYASAGSPILAYEELTYNGETKKYPGILVTSVFGDVPEGYEPVNLFCGGPAFDFNGGGNWEAIQVNENGKVYAGHGTESSEFWTSHTYVYFNPSVKYTSGTSYLGGLAFFSTEYTKKEISSTQAQLSSNYAYMEEMHWSPLSRQNVGGMQFDTETLLCYTETFNPYRAIYDIRFYEAELAAVGVAYNLNQNGMAYVACDVFAEGGGGLSSDLRTIRATHAYRSPYWYEGGGLTDLMMALTFGKQYVSKSTLSHDFAGAYQGNYEVEKTSWYPYEAYHTINSTGLYVGGNNGSDSPLTLEDLYITSSPKDVPSSLEYTPVRDFKDSYGSCANISKICRFEDCEYLFIYIRRPDPNREKPKYIKSVTVAYAGDVDTSTPSDYCTYQLIGQGTGTLVEYNLASNATKAKYALAELSAGGGLEIAGHEIISGDTKEYQIMTPSYNGGSEVAYMWITYTNKSSDALSDLVLYETDRPGAPTTLEYYYNDTQTKATVANRCGSGWKEDGVDGTYYFLYSITHNGHVITDVHIGNTPMYENYWTTLGDENKVTSMQRCYIHTLHKETALGDSYIQDLKIGTGADTIEAQKSLLNQGCRYAVQKNLNRVNGDEVVLMGYVLTTSYKKALTHVLLVESGQDDTITGLENGWDKYVMLTDNLNGASDNLVIKLFGSNSQRLAEINGNSKSKGRYISNIKFINSCKETFEEENEDGEIWNWNLVTDPDGNPQALSMGLDDSPNQKYAEGMYMYVHYSDNSIEAGGLLGSIFVNNRSLAFVIIVLFLMIATMVVLIIRKRRMQKEIL